MKKVIVFIFMFELVMMLFGPNGIHPDPDATEKLIGYGYEHPGWYEYP